MNEFEVKLKVSTNMVGVKWEAVIDLVEDFGLEEDEVRDYIANDFFGNDFIDQMLRDHALELCKFDWGVSRCD